MSSANIVLRIGASCLSLHRRAGGEPAVCGAELVASLRWALRRSGPSAQQATEFLVALLCSTCDAQPTYEIVLADEVREWDYGYLITLEQRASWESSGTILQSAEWRAYVIRLNPGIPAFDWDFEAHTCSLEAFALEISALTSRI